MSTPEKLPSSETTTSRRARRLAGRFLLPWLLPLVVVAFLVAERDGGDSSPTETTTTTVAAPSTSTAKGSATTGKATTTKPDRPSTTAADSAALANGTHPVYLAAVDTGRRTITVDVVQVLDRRSAQAAKVCPEIANGDIDGYCISNTNARLRTVPVPTTASLQVLNGSSLRKVDLAGLAAARRPQKEDSFFEVTVAGGKVTPVKELYRA